MDIFSEISAVRNRIAQISGTSDDAAALASSVAAAPPTGGRAALAGAPAGVDGAGTPNSGSFAALLNDALRRQEMGASAGDAAAGGAMTSPPQIADLVARNAAAWHVDPALLNAIIENESGFDPHATSPVGAQGLMQLMPETAVDLGVGDAYDPAQNVWGGARYLRSLLDRFNGDLRLAVAAYNAGPGAVERYGGVPPYAETQAYVGNVLDAYQRYKAR